MDKRKGNEGFSLVEVLIAITILAIITLPILSVFSSAAKTNARAKKIENANTAASNVIEEIKNVSIEDLDSNALNYNYVKADDDLSGEGTKKYLVTNNSEDYFIGIDGEKYIIEASLDPSYYSDDTSNGQLNLNNNVNSASLSSYTSLNKDKNILYNDDSINEEASTYFLEATGDYFDKNCIKKTSTINISILKNEEKGDFTSYIQKLDLKVNYSYESEDSRFSNINDYVREFNLVTREIIAAKYESEDYDYIISSSNEYENNANKVYIFYNIYDDFDETSQSHLDNGREVQYAKDEVNISYCYDTNYNPRVLFSDLNVFFIEQEKTTSNTSVKLNYDNINCDYYSDASKINSENSSQKEVSKDLVVSVFFNVENFVLQIEEGLSYGTKNYIYKLIVKVYANVKDEENLITTMVTTKID